MKLRTRKTWLIYGSLLLPLTCVALCGCLVPARPKPITEEALGPLTAASLEIDYPDVHTLADPQTIDPVTPITISADELPPARMITLEEVIRTSLSNSKVLRELGGTLLNAPDSVRTVMDPAIRETHPQFGVDGALSEFDASFAANAFFEKNDRAVNNVFLGGGTRIFQQDLGVFDAEIAKRNAFGGDFVIRHTADYDANNAPGNVFGSAWTTKIEGELRQPLLQGAGVEYNRIAGPNGEPGLPRGVVVARINTDITLAEFEIGVRDLVSDVEDAYWELYYAYRDLDAKIECRDLALETWRIIKAWNDEGLPGGEAEFEAQAREQYYRFQIDVQNALAGNPLEKTRTEAFRASGGVLANERRMRYLMGVPINDKRLLRPADDPPLAEVKFQWDEIVSEAHVRRPELRRQQWLIKRREMELLASKNYLLPRVDVVGRYRWRGFGKDLAASRRGGRPRFDNAWMDLTSGDFQEWQMGLEVDIPIGFRQANASVRYAELNLVREKAVLEEQQNAITHDLSSAYGEMARAYTVAQSTYNRRQAALEQLKAIRAQEPEPNQQALRIKLELDGQRRLCDAESQYYRSVAEYARAIKEVHLQKGSLLDYNQVFLSEADWPAHAYRDAAELESRRRPAALRQHMSRQAPTVAAGRYVQRAGNEVELVDELEQMEEIQPPANTDVPPPRALDDPQ